MYQKIKYIIIATFVLLIAVVILTLDANTRYASMKQKDTPSNSRQENVNAQLRELERMQLVQTAPPNTNSKDIPDDVQNKLNEYKTQETSLQNSQEISTAQENGESTNLDGTSSQQQSTAEPTDVEILSTPAENLVCEKCPEGQTYSFEKVFKIDGEEYAIISSTNNLEENATYAIKKFAIYKKVDNEYKYSNYLFETTVDTTPNAKPNTVDINGNNGSVSVIFKGATNIKRNFDNYVIKNGYSQYSSYPTLKCQGATGK